MASSGLYRWAGYAGIVGAILLVIGDWLHPQTIASNPSGWQLAHELLFISIVLAIPGLFGVYARQSRETGSLGFIGFVLVFIGLMGFSASIAISPLADPSTTSVQWSGRSLSSNERFRISSA